jgi:general stress protein YciG
LLHRWDSKHQGDPDMPQRRDTDDRRPGASEGMSVREAGRKGGNTTRERYGSGFFQEIGAKGGKTVSERYPSDHFREIGRKGGRRVAELIARAKELDTDLQEE